MLLQPHWAGRRLHTLLGLHPGDNGEPLSVPPAVVPSQMAMERYPNETGPPHDALTHVLPSSPSLPSSPPPSGLAVGPRPNPGQL